jgi:hypothetical protein
MVSTLVYAIPSNLLRGTLMLTGIGDGMEGESRLLLFDLTKMMTWQ